MNTQDFPTALIVEDDLFSAKLYERLLSSVGYDSVVSTNYDQAEAYLKDHIPELVVLDMRLEHKNTGPDVLHLLRNQVRFKNTRIIIITAYSTMIEEYGEMADMVVLKPMNARELISYAEEEMAT